MVAASPGSSMLGAFRDLTRGWKLCPLCNGVPTPWLMCSECGGIGKVPPMKRSVLATPKADRTCSKPGCISPLLATAPAVRNDKGEFHPGCWESTQPGYPSVKPRAVGRMGLSDNLQCLLAPPPLNPERQHH